MNNNLYLLHKNNEIYYYVNNDVSCMEVDFNNINSKSTYTKRIISTKAQTLNNILETKHKLEKELGFELFLYKLNLSIDITKPLSYSFSMNGEHFGGVYHDFNHLLNVSINSIKEDCIEKDNDGDYIICYVKIEDEVIEKYKVYISSNFGMSALYENNPYSVVRYEKVD